MLFILWTINIETLSLFDLAAWKLSVKFHAPFLGTTVGGLSFTYFGALTFSLVSSHFLL